MPLSRTSLVASLVAALACPLLAHAEDATHRFSVVAGYAAVEPTKNVAGYKLSGEGVSTLGATYNFNEHWAVELWASEAYGTRFKVQNEPIGSVDAQPLALSAQYHFRSADKILRPFVGLGYHETNYDHQTGILGPPKRFETVKGGMATAGVDITLSPRWFARVDARYLEGTSDITINGSKEGLLKLEPVMVSVGVGVRF